MQKTLLLLVFFLSILRGSGSLHAQDSLRIFVSSQLTDTVCGYKYRVTVQPINATAPFSFMIDSIWSSTTGIFENIPHGEHTAYCKDANGKIGITRFSLAYGNVSLLFRTYPIPEDCNSRVGSFGVQLFSLRRPVTYKLDNGSFQTDTIYKNIPVGYHALTVKDAVGCEFTQAVKVENIFNADYLFRYTSACNQPGDFIITSFDAGLTFKLNGIAPIKSDSGTWIWRNVLPTAQRLEIFKGTCSRVDAFNLTSSSSLQAEFVTIPDSCHTDSIGVYRINVTGGQAPYTYTIDGLNFTTNAFRLAPQTYHRIKVTDVNNCTFDGGLYTPYIYENYGNYPNVKFVPNSCGDSIGKLTLSFKHIDSLLTKPLSISFNGRPFSADTVFTNIKGNRVYDLRIKTKAGCEKKLSVYTFYPRSEISIYDNFTITNCSAQTGELQISSFGGSQPYKYFIDNQAVASTTDTSLIVKNLKVGNTYTIKVVSAEGCETTKRIIQYNYHTQSCGETAPLHVYPFSNMVGKVLRLDNTLGQIDTSGFMVWQNISSGKHEFTLTDSLGCVRKQTIILEAFGLPLSSERVRTNCTDSTSLDYRIVATGVPPYTVSYGNKLDTIMTNNIIVRLREGWNTVYVKDAKYCYNYLNINTFNEFDTVKVSYRFLPNSCNDSVGTLSMSIIDPNPNILRPLSISVNGRPFSADTLIKNIGFGDGIFTVKIKTTQGCELKTRLFIPYLQPLGSYTVPTCANRFGRGSAGIQVYGGTPPYAYKSSLIGNITNLSDIPTGTHTITVTDAAGCITGRTFTLTTCVWSGDTDTSGVVNQNDVLNIGLAYGSTGFVRSYCNNSFVRDTCMFWREQYGADWSKQTPDKVNFKHIDTNGDGIINNADTMAIKRNWSKTRTLTNDPILVVRNATPLYIQTNSIGVNQWGAFPIMLGDANSPANGIYGLAFTITYDPSVIDASTVYFTHNQSWMGASSELLSIFNNESGRLDIGLTKINQTNANGKGQIGTIHFKLKSGVANKALNFNVLEPKMINNNAVVIPTSPVATSTTVTSIAEPEWASRLIIQPNPTTGDFYIDINEATIQQVKIFDISGKLIDIKQNVNRDTPLSIEPIGTFFLQIQTDKGMISRKIVRIN
jgi:hypothetical protein